MTSSTVSIRRRIVSIAAVAGLLVAVLPAHAVAAVPIDRTATVAETSAVPDATVAPAAVSSARIRLSTIITGLSSPVLVTHANDGSGRLFIVEKTGKVRVMKAGKLLPGAFISLAASVSKGGEQGLLGLAFHPSFKTNRKFYVSYTNLAGDSVIREYLASPTNPDVVQTGSGRTILTVDQPYDNHNGGHIAFGPDGYLYIGFGDGGSAGDPNNYALNLNSMLGKLLRIDVNGTTSTKAYRIPSTNPYVGKAGLDEIWSRGLRNPWRFSFDRSTGNLWIGDVGQSKWEEVSRSIRTSTTYAGRGVNYGWKTMEGRHCYSPATGCSYVGTQPPVAEYAHSGGRCSISGGYVYRGSAITALKGGYLFGDYCTGEIWVVDQAGVAPIPLTRLLDTTLNITSFGEDQAGELYVLSYGGTVSKVLPG